MQQKTRTRLQQRRNRFCLRRSWVILMFWCQLSWLLPVWGKEETEWDKYRNSHLCARGAGQEVLSAELGLVVGIPGKPAWARRTRVCVGKGYPTGKDPPYLLQLALANCLSHSLEVVSPPGAVILLLPFSHLLSLVI